MVKIVKVTLNKTLLERMPGNLRIFFFSPLYLMLSQEPCFINTKLFYESMYFHK